jgi:hypothetical protein
VWHVHARHVKKMACARVACALPVQVDAQVLWLRVTLAFAAEALAEAYLKYHEAIDKCVALTTNGAPRSTSPALTELLAGRGAGS